MKNRGLLLNLLRYGLWALLFALGIETAVRVDDWASDGASPLGNYSYENLLEKDEIGQHGKPFAHCLKWRLNSHGFRGPELN